MLLISFEICVLLIHISIWQIHGLIWTNFQALRPQKGSNVKKSYETIDKNTSSLKNLTDGSLFGWSMANIGDLDGDGNVDMAVGAIGDSCIDENGALSLRCGSIYILFLSDNSTVRESVQITGGLNGGPIYLTANDNFGFSVCNMGDVDGDNVTDLAVGAPGTYTGGVLYILFMKPNGHVRNYTYVRGAENGGGPPVFYLGRFASVVGNIGDIDNDGINEVAVQQGDSASGNNIVYILYLYPTGDVRRYKQLILIDPTTNAPVVHEPFSNFGSSFANLGDLDNDGSDDFAIGISMYSDPSGLSYAGGVYIVFNMTQLNSTDLTSWILLTDASPSDGIPIKVQYMNTTNNA